MKTISERHDRREFKRLSVNEQGFLISREQDGEIFSVRLNDVSTKGIGFSANRFFNKDKKFNIHYSILNHAFNLPIKIIWTKQMREDICIGCKKEQIAS